MSRHALSLENLFSWWGLGTGILLLLGLDAAPSILCPIPWALSQSITRRPVYFDRSLR